MTENTVFVEFAKRRLALEKRIKAYNDKIKPLKEELDELNQDLLAALKAAGTEQAAVPGRTIVIKRAIHGKIVDYETYRAWMFRTKNDQLMYRRISSTALEDLLETRNFRAIPGIEIYEKETVNMPANKKTGSKLKRK